MHDLILALELLLVLKVVRVLSLSGITSSAQGVLSVHHPCHITWQSW